eukprot:scaffold238494_cov20-Tisochrysis_lutea.AAC.1
MLGKREGGERRAGAGAVLRSSATPAAAAAAAAAVLESGPDLFPGLWADASVEMDAAATGAPSGASIFGWPGAVGCSPWEQPLDPGRGEAGMGSASSTLLGRLPPCC